MIILRKAIQMIQLNKGNTLSCYAYGNNGMSNASTAMPTHNTLSNKIANMHYIKIIEINI